MRDLLYPLSLQHRKKKEYHSSRKVNDLLDSAKTAEKKKGEAQYPGSPKKKNRQRLGRKGAFILLSFDRERKKRHSREVTQPKHWR